MAGTVTKVETGIGNVYKIKFAWTSASTGAADGTTAKAYSGTLMRVRFEPGTSTSQPTASYDVVVNDSDSIDILNGIGANLANDANADYTPVTTTKVENAVAESKLTLGVTNAGDTKTGTVYLWIHR